jgi:hypothetical protein
MILWQTHKLRTDRIVSQFALLSASTSVWYNYESVHFWGANSTICEPQYCLHLQAPLPVDLPRLSDWELKTVHG